MFLIMLACYLVSLNGFQDCLPIGLQEAMPVTLILPGQRPPHPVNMAFHLDSHGVLSNGGVIRVRASQWPAILKVYPPEYRFVCCFGLDDDVLFWSPVVLKQIAMLTFQAYRCHRRVAILITPWSIN
jgi:hypothetical protein